MTKGTVDLFYCTLLMSKKPKHPRTAVSEMGLRLDLVSKQKTEMLHILGGILLGI